MKHLTTGAFLLLLSFFSFCAHAQKDTPPVNEPDFSKPKLFADLPQKFLVNIAALETLLDLPEGQTIKAPFTKSFQFQGVVVSKSAPNDTLVKSVVIRSTNRQGAGFSFTRIRNAAGQFEYSARIISLHNSDAFELAREGEQYYLVKKNLYDIFSE
jgi:hypothetical protein